MNEKKRLFVSACEVSANIHLKAVAKYLPRDIEICGVFEATVFSDFTNAKPSYTLENFAVMGFLDVFKKWRFFTKAIAQMSQLASSCDVALLMDSSSFHIPIAKTCHKHKMQGISQVQIVYYILPQVWAWKPWRAKNLTLVCDYLCAILPFELMMYKNALKLKKIRYVGHPLLDEILYFKSAPTPLENGIVAFMPGSRKAEIKRIFPIFRSLSKKIPNIKTKILVLPSHFKTMSTKDLNAIYGDLSGFDISFEANKALFEANFAFVCSGTATLQATLIGTPLVLGYKARWFDVWIARLFVRLKHIGLANIFYNALRCGSHKSGDASIHIELIQNELNVENLLKAYENMNINTFFAKSLQIREYLQNGSAKNVGDLIMNLLNNVDNIKLK